MAGRIRPVRMDTAAPGRLFPLSKQQYDGLAIKIWEREGKPNFTKQIVDGVVFGNPILTHNEGYKTRFRTYYTNKIKERKIGVMFLRTKENKLKLFPIIQSFDFASLNNYESFMNENNIKHEGYIL